MVALLFTIGGLGALLFFACLAILFFIAEPGWLFAWLIGSAAIALLACGLAVAVLAYRDRRSGR